MSRATAGPSIAEALAGAVLFGDIPTDQARRALLRGLPDDLPAFRSDDPEALRSARQAAADGRPALLHLTGAPTPWGAVGNAGCSIPHKIGAFWSPQAFDAARTLRAADLYAKGARAALRSGKGARSNRNVRLLLAVAVESDCGTKRAQADMIDKLERRGVRVPIVVDSGDTRPESARALRPDVNIEGGKSLHLTIPIRAVEVGNPDHARAMAALLVLIRGDLKATDPARLLRLPGVAAGTWGAKRARAFCPGETVRLQTLLRADADAEPWDVAELADALEAICADLGLDVAAGVEALRVAAELRLAAGKREAGAAAVCLEAAMRCEALARVPDDVRELADAIGANGTRKGKGGIGSAVPYDAAELPRDAMVRALWNGEPLELPFHAWGALLSSVDLGAHGTKGPRGVAAWTPTPAGLRHTTGERAGCEREAPAGTLWAVEGRVRLACHVEGRVYVPSLPRDPAAEPPPFPAAGAPPYLAPATLASGSVTILRSDTGTGKTHWLAGWLRRVAGLIVTPRIAIAAEAVRRYGAIDYRSAEAREAFGKVEEAQGCLFDGGRRVAACINSICKIRLPDVDDGPFWLVLEESEQVAAALFGGTVPLLPEAGRAHAAKVLEALGDAARLAVESGGGVVCADAFAGDQTRALLRALLGDDVAPVEVGIARRRKIAVRFWTDQAGDDDDRATKARDAMRSALFDAARDGRRVMLACLTSREACAVAEVFASLHKRNGDPVRVRLYVGDDEPHLGSIARAPLDELADVNRAWGPEVADVVIFSPVVSAAVSYDRTDKGAAFDIAALDAPRVPHADWTLCLQMLDRARRPGEVWIYAPERDAGCVVEVAGVEAYRARKVAAWKADVRADAAARGFDVEALEPRDTGLAELAAVCEYASALRGADVAGALRAFFEARGARLIGCDDVAASADAETLRKARKDARKRRKGAWGDLVCGAAPYSDAGELRQSAKRLRNTRKLPVGPERDAELARVESHKLRDRYGAAAVTPRLVDDDRDGKVWTRTRELVRAGLIADGMTQAATGRAGAIVEAGCSAGARGDAQRTIAALLLLRGTLGGATVAGLLAPLRDPDATTQGAPMLKEPMPIGDADPLEAQWSAATLDGASCAAELWRDLARHGIDPRLLEGTGMHPGAVAADPVRATGIALRRFGIATCSTRQRQAGEGVARIYRIDGDAWRASLALAGRRNARKRGRGVPSAFACDDDDRRDVWIAPDAERPEGDPHFSSKVGSILRGVDHAAPEPPAPPPSWTAAAV